MRMVCSSTRFSAVWCNTIHGRETNIVGGLTSGLALFPCWHLPHMGISCRKGIAEREHGAVLTPERNKNLIRRWLVGVFTRADLAEAEELFTLNYALPDPSFPR